MFLIIIKISLVFNMYIECLSSVDVYTYLTITSEILNLFRVLPFILMLKIVVDMHREFIKINIF